MSDETRDTQGFTLIEVLIAVMILAMALVTVFGSNIGAARQTAHARAMTRAVMMARCRMVELDAYLHKNQLPATEQTVEDPPEMGGEPCCTDGVTCEAKVELIELPSPTAVETEAGNALLGRASQAARGTSFTGGGDAGVGGAGGGALGMLAGALGTLGTSGGASGGGSLSDNGAPSPQGIATQLMTTVYPTIKPMLEGAIRRVTVRVSWREGDREQHFDVVEYATNPGQTLMAPGANPDDPLGLGARGTGATGQGNTGSTPTPGPSTSTGVFTGTLPGGLPFGLPGR